MRDKVNDSVRLELILDAIDNIEEYLTGTETSEDLKKNKILCHAVVYNLQCIGECVYKLSSEFINAVWNIIQKDVPNLKHYLNELFAEQASDR